MNDQWVPSPPQPPTPPVNPLPLANSWNTVAGCSVGPNQPSFVDGVVITGVPAAVTAPYAWRVMLNDGNTPPNFSIDHLDSSSNLIDSPMAISGVDGSVQFNDPVFLARDPVEPMEAVTLEYMEAHATGISEPPDNQTYGRTLGAWNLVVPAAGGTFTGQTNLSAGGAVTGGALLFAGNAVCSVPTVAQLQIGDGSAGQVPTADGSGNLTWTTPTTGGPYLPLSGGTITGSLTVNQVLTVQGSNSLVLNAPVTGGNQRSIMSMASNVVRWVLTLGDQTAEGAGNVGSNFSLSAYSTTGASLGNWLTIARADGSTVFNGSGVTIAGGLAVNGLLVLASPNNLAIYGGSAGQFLQTDGTGILSWATVPPSGIADAPNDGTAYARKSLAWSHLTHSDITDWTASLAVYAPLASPALSGVPTAPTATVGTNTTQLATTAFVANAVAGGTAGVASFNTRTGIVTLTNADVTAVLPSSSTAPAMDGTAAAGTSTAWSRGDHVHPTDTSRAPLASPTFTGTVNVPGWYFAPSGSSLVALTASASYVTVASSGATQTLTFLNSWGSIAAGIFAVQDVTGGAGSVANYLSVRNSTTGNPAQIATLGADTNRSIQLVPAGTGTVQAPTAAPGTATTQIATTAFVAAAVIGDNRIINGDMRIDQRNGGASGTIINAYTIDRWVYYATQASKGTWGRILNTVVSAAGFPYYLGFQSSSAYTPLAADGFGFWQAIEADQVGDITQTWGTANAQAITLSFWVRSSLTGTFGAAIQNYAQTRSYPFTYSIPTANIWTNITVTIPGDTAGTWVYAGPGGALQLIFDLGSGSSLRGPAGAWATTTPATARQSVTGAVSVVATNGATFYVTGVKLEIGSVATPFNRQSLAKSMADCQRYYQIATNVMVQGYQAAGNVLWNEFFLPVMMRAAPTTSISAISATNASGLGFDLVTTYLVRGPITITATGYGYAQCTLALSAEL